MKKFAALMMFVAIFAFSVGCGKTKTSDSSSDSKTDSKTDKTTD